MSALSRDVHCFWFCSATQNQRLLKESIQIDAKIRETHQHVTSEHRAPRAVPLSKVSLPFRASVQAFSKKCGVFRVLRCSLVGLAGLIRWCTCYQHSEVQFVFMKNPWNAECIKMRAKFDLSSHTHTHTTHQNYSRRREKELCRGCCTTRRRAHQVQSWLDQNRGGYPCQG